MSECWSTPTVMQVSTLPMALLLGGAILTVVLVRRWTQSMAGHRRRAFEEALRAMPRLEAGVLKAPSLVEQQARSRLKALTAQLENLRLGPADAVRLSGLIRVASAPFVVQSPALVEQRLASLMSAKTVEAAIAARRALTQTVSAAHRQVFAGAVAQACSNAAQQIGFGRVERSTGRRGELRVVAANDQGQVLVAEIHLGAAGDPSLAAEVVGVRDGSCCQIVDAFEKALASQGVRYAPSRRRPTGGVCQLEAAREFLHAGASRAGADSRNDKRRVQRLNQKQEVIIR